MNKKKTVLIVEDEVILSKVLQDKLFDNGFDVVYARNGAEGLEKLSEGNIDLILLDIIMPVLDGMDMLRILREERKSKIPVIVLTNLGSDDDAKVALGSGASEFLIKANHSLDDVLNKIQEILG